jgi:hypothetical protein
MASSSSCRAPHAGTCRRCNSTVSVPGFPAAASCCLCRSSPSFPAAASSPQAVPRCSCRWRPSCPVAAPAQPQLLFILYRRACDAHASQTGTCASMHESGQRQRCRVTHALTDRCGQSTAWYTTQESRQRKWCPSPVCFAQLLLDQTKPTPQPLCMEACQPRA